MTGFKEAIGAELGTILPHGWPDCALHFVELSTHKASIDGINKKDEKGKLGKGEVM